MKNVLLSIKIIWLSTSSFMFSAVIKIAGNSNNYQWLIQKQGLFVKITFKGGDLFGSRARSIMYGI